jgi:histone acetyltransferase (RNA polymerase elongator complex component)
MDRKKSLLIIPIFLPHQGCPHQCSFCNQNKISGTPSGLPSTSLLTKEINRYLSFKRDPDTPVQIAFYGGNFLGIPFPSIIMLLNEAVSFVHAGKADSIRFSTRPDTINKEILDKLKQFRISTIELGAQSMDDRILSLSNRGHTAEDTVKAALIIKQHNIQLGIQMMTGLPGDEGRQSIETANKIVGLSPDFVRIYPTIVLSESPLEKSYQRGEYVPMSLENSVKLAAKIYCLFTENGIPVIRMGLQASDGLEKNESIVAGPFHPAFGHLVLSEIFLKKAKELLQCRKNITDKEAVIHVHATGISKMRGLKNQNIHALKQMFGLKAVHILSDNALSKNQLMVNICE